MTSKNSWREMARVAGTPRPEYRARTSRSADRYQRDVLPPRRLESILPAGFQYSQKIRLRVRNRAPWSAQISDQERDPAAAKQGGCSGKASGSDARVRARGPGRRKAIDMGTAHTGLRREHASCK